MRPALRLAARVLESNFRRLDFPYKLTFAVTYRCNCRCTLCAIWRKAEVPELSLDEIRAFFRKSNRFSWVDLTGGEVLLRPDFTDIAAAVVEHCPDLRFLHFPTNGILPEETVAAVREILALGPPRLVVTVSLDGPPDLHDELRGVPGTFDRALRTYRALRGLGGVRVYLGLTLSQHNCGRFGETLEAVRRAAPGAGPRDIHVNLAHGSSHYYGAVPPLQGDTGAVREALRAIRRARGVPGGALDWLETLYLKWAETFLGSGRSPLPCQALSATCFLDPSGVVYPCVGFGMPAGNVREVEGDLAALWRSARAQEVVACVQRGDCPGCWTPCEAFPALAGSLRGAWARRRSVAKE